MLYLIGNDKSYTAIEIIYRKKDGSIADWSVKHTWKTANQPLDIAQSFDKKYAFILESDNNVHIYSIEGKKYRKVPVPSGTVAITIPSRKRTFSLINHNRIYKNIKIPLL
jgi:hypothetical protein